MNANKFREELVKIMPGYKWTVSRPPKLIMALGDGSVPYLEATGVQTSGSNRTSTLSVIRNNKDGKITYSVKSSGFGLKSPWLAERTDGTLARALRSLQEHYEQTGRNYSAHARDLQLGRKKDDQP